MTRILVDFIVLLTIFNASTGQTSRPSILGFSIGLSSEQMHRILESQELGLGEPSSDGWRSSYSTKHPGGEGLPGPRFLLDSDGKVIGVEGHQLNVCGQEFRWSPMGLKLSEIEEVLGPPDRVETLDDPERSRELTSSVYGSLALVVVSSRPYHREQSFVILFRLLQSVDSRCITCRHGDSLAWPRAQPQVIDDFGGLVEQLQGMKLIVDRTASTIE